MSDATRGRWWLGCAALAALAAGAWLGRDAPWAQPIRALGARLTQAAQPDAASQPFAGSLHKCLQGNRVLYTDAPCPAGSQSQAVAGSLTVVPAVPAATGASAPANARPLLRQLDSGELRQRQMDAVIGQ